MALEQFILRSQLQAYWDLGRYKIEKTCHCNDWFSGLDNEPYHVYKLWFDYFSTENVNSLSGDTPSINQFSYTIKQTAYSLTSDMTMSQDQFHNFCNATGNLQLVETLHAIFSEHCYGGDNRQLSREKFIYICEQLWGKIAHVDVHFILDKSTIENEVQFRRLTSSDTGKFEPVNVLPILESDDKFLLKMQATADKEKEQTGKDSLHSNRPNVTNSFDISLYSSLLIFPQANSLEAYVTNASHVIDICEVRHLLHDINQHLCRLHDRSIILFAHAFDIDASCSSLFSPFVLNSCVNRDTIFRLKSPLLSQALNKEGVGEPQPWIWLREFGNHTSKINSVLNKENLGKYDGICVIPPELYDTDVSVQYSIDSWCLGWIVHALSTRNVVFKGRRSNQNKSPNFLTSGKRWTDEDAEILVVEIIQSSLSEGLFSQGLLHLCELACDLLESKVARRLDVKDISKSPFFKCSPDELMSNLSVPDGLNITNHATVKSALVKLHTMQRVPAFETSSMRSPTLENEALLTKLHIMETNISKQLEQLECHEGKYIIPPRSNGLNSPSVQMLRNPQWTESELAMQVLSQQQQEQQLKLASNVDKILQKIEQLPESQVSLAASEGTPLDSKSKSAPTQQPRKPVLRKSPSKKIPPPRTKSKTLNSPTALVERPTKQVSKDLVISRRMMSLDDVSILEQMADKTYTTDIDSNVSTDNGTTQAISSGDISDLENRIEKLNQNLADDVIEQLTEQMIEILNEQMNMQTALSANQRMTNQILNQLDQKEQDVPTSMRFRRHCAIM